MPLAWLLGWGLSRANASEALSYHMAEGKRSSLAGILILYTRPGRIQPLGRSSGSGHWATQGTFVV